MKPITVYHVYNDERVVQQFTVKTSCKSRLSHITHMLCLMIYCGLNNNTFKLFLIEHMEILVCLPIEFVRHYVILVMVMDYYEGIKDKSPNCMRCLIGIYVWNIVRQPE